MSSKSPCRPCANRAARTSIGTHVASRGREYVVEKSSRGHPHLKSASVQRLEDIPAPDDLAHVRIKVLVDGRVVLYVL